jgi:hypothetical protein
VKNNEESLKKGDDLSPPKSDEKNDEDLSPFSSRMDGG